VDVEWNNVSAPGPPAFPPGHFPFAGGQSFPPVDVDTTAGVASTDGGYRILTLPGWKKVRDDSVCTPWHYATMTTPAFTAGGPSLAPIRMEVLPRL